MHISRRGSLRFVPAILLPITSFLCLAAMECPEAGDISNSITQVATWIDDFRNVTLSIEPAGPLTMEEGEERDVVVVGRRTDTGELRPFYETVAELIATDASIVTIVKGTPGADGAHDGRATFRVTALRTGNVDLRARLNGSSIREPHTDFLASASLAVSLAVRSLQVSPSGPITLKISDRQTIEFQVLNAAGAPIPGFEDFVTVLSSNTAVVSGTAPTILPSDGVGTWEITAQSTGEANLTFQYRSGTPVTVRVIVEPSAPTGSVVASTPNAQAIPGHDIILRALVRDAAGNSFPGGEPFVQATSSNPGIATIQARTEGAADGTVEFTVRGVSPGNAEIRYTYPGAPPAVTSLTVVDAPAGRVVSVQSGAQMHAGTTIVLTARVRDPITNALVPGSDPFITARSGNQAIATVLGKDEGIPGDGEVTFTIRGDSPGVTIILFRYPGSDDDMTILTVNP
jgi:hypothetical protein